jgi:hypothetical protein
LEEHYTSVIRPRPLHNQRRRVESIARFLPGMKAGPGVVALSRWAAAGDLSIGREELEALAIRLDAVFPESRAVLALRMDEAIRAGEVRQILLNGDFGFDDMLADPESDEIFSTDYVPLSWLRWGGETGVSRLALSDQKAAAGRLSLRAEGSIKESVFQPFSVQGGRGYAYFAQAKGVVSPGSRIEIRLTWLDVEGEVIDPEFLDLDPLLPGIHDAWQSLGIYAEAPPQAVGGIAHVTVHHQGPGDIVYFDDMRLYGEF